MTYKAKINGEWVDINLIESPEELTAKLEKNEEWAKVVRCIECKHCRWADHYDPLIAVDPLNYCPGEFDYFCDCFDVETEADSYCSWGERRENGIPSGK